MAAMSFTLRTPAHGSLTVGYRLAAPRRHPTFATDKPAHPALSALTSSSSSLQGIVQASLPSALASFVSSHCALHLNLAEKVLAPAACGSTRTAIAEAHTAVSVAIGYRLAAPHRHPIDFSLRLPNAQSSLFRNACSGPVAHSPPSIGWFFIPIPCKPNTLTAFGGVRAVS